jgi:hypothetical protein
VAMNKGVKDRLVEGENFGSRQCLITHGNGGFIRLTVYRKLGLVYLLIIFVFFPHLTPQIKYLRHLSLIASISLNTQTLNVAIQMDPTK